jgi:penicillin-binding protein 1A
MAQAYAPFSNGGFFAKAYGIERIRTAGGRVLYDHSMGGDQRRPVIGQPALAYMNEMMRQVLVSGTGTRARVPGYDLAGKTGTTSDYRDAWFIGYTGGFVTAIWVGRDDNTPMHKVTGGATPAGIWREYMGATLPKLQVIPIPGSELPQAPPVVQDAIGDLLAGQQTQLQRPPEGPVLETPQADPNAPPY